jgi:predicted acylesterase/phospholipase RssA
MRPVPSPSDLLETLVDYLIIENVPISHVDGQFFRIVLCRLDPTVGSHLPIADELRRPYCDELSPFVSPRR